MSASVDYKLLDVSSMPSRLICAKCKTVTNHLVIADFEEDGVEYDDEEEVQIYAWLIHHQIVQCAGCGGVSFRKTYTDSTPNESPADTVASVEYFPPRDLVESLNWRQLPTQLGQIYFETLKAISSRMPILAAVGIRALIEAICKERKANGSNLNNRIDALVTIGIVTSDGAKMLHSLRILGNAAAHEVQPPNTDQLKAAFEVVNHMLNGTYLLPRAIQGLLPSGEHH